MSRTFIILNGARRKWETGGKLARQLVAVSTESGHQVRLEISRSQDEGQTLLEEARRWDADAVWIGGGDGTAHIMVNAALRDRFAIGVLPMGTVNALARSLGLPMNPVSAARLLAQSQPRLFRPMTFANRVVLCFVSVGFDARVVHHVASTGGLKRWLGRYAYVTTAFQHLTLLPRVPEIQIRTRDIQRACRGVILSRISNYAGFPIFREVAQQPDQIQWHDLQGGRPLDLAALAFSSLVGRGAKPQLCNSMDLYPTEPGSLLHFQADGEALAVEPGPVRIGLAEEPVQLLAPENRVRGLAFTEQNGPLRD